MSKNKINVDDDAVIAQPHKNTAKDSTPVRDTVLQKDVLVDPDEIDPFATDESYVSEDKKTNESYQLDVDPFAPTPIAQDLDVDPFATDNIGEKKEVEEKKVVEEKKEEEGDKKESEDDTQQSPMKPQCFTQEHEVFKDKCDYLNESRIQLPSQTTERTLGPISAALNMELREDDRTRNWAFTLSRGHSKNTMNGALTAAMYKGDWRQSVASEVGPLSGGKPRINAVENVKLHGKEAILRLLSHVGGATNYQIPLWHTGIWINVDPITDTDVLQLFRELNDDKIQLGRYTNGAVFSNTSAFTTKRIVDFIISKIGETTYKPSKDSPKTLEQIISINDIPLLILTLCNSMHPNGFKHNRSCVYNPKKCHHTYSGVVDFDKILWTNTEALTKHQIKLMSTACNGQVDDKTLKTWSELLETPSSRVVDVETLSGSMVKFFLTVPKYDKYVDSGHIWLNGIADAIGESISIDDIAERNKFIDDNARATILRQYTHYISHVEFGEGNVIDEPNDIEDVLDVLSGDDNVRKTLVKAITDFIDDTTMSLVGIPTYECPECGGGQTDESRGIYKHILPLDMIELFFLILIDRVKKIKMTDI